MALSGQARRVITHACGIAAVGKEVCDAVDLNTTTNASQATTIASHTSTLATHTTQIAANTSNIVTALARVAAKVSVLTTAQQTTTILKQKLTSTLAFLKTAGLMTP